MTKPINVMNSKFFNPEPLKLNLQFFADPNDPPADPPADPPQDPPAKLELTQEELDKKIEAEADRKLSKSLEKKRAEWEKEKKQIEADAKKTAEEYAKLTAKEKEDAEYQKRVEALEKREQELNNKQLLSEIQTDLKDNSLPGEFAESLLTIQDNEKIKKQISVLKKSFDDAVQEKVKEALRQETPKGSTGASGSKNPWNQGEINLTEQTRIFKENPERAKQLMAQAK
ncbi:capsid assembly scaffolding protein Gp46 family protein [Aquibacillus rhizosphaerae]|uniref:DUF4355 domain-containing protein n=1 Tax=Aquibacillus rhizosphaerae TaxID=3051431 RepID=A0ABT7LAD4_9BACI|nr:DUF4355 domain-containing protein [Aquibacillus sp. LR5S19]MDL4842829.1 DUF4355 domain-containing protein [Aquibacillus sp. LR5S19]